MSKKIKAMQIDHLRQTFEGVRSFIMVAPIKVNAELDYQFRKQLREKNIHTKLVRNNFMKIVMKENDLEAIDKWSGPTLMCWGAGSVKELSKSVEKMIKDLHKDPKAPQNYEIKQAVADGEMVSMEVAKTLPTREEAIGDVVGALLGPASSILGGLTSAGSNIASILKAIEEKDRSGEAAA